MRRLTATLAVSALALVGLTGCAAGPVVSRDVDIDDATSVVLSTSGDLVITRGEPSLSITANEAVLGQLVTEVRDGVLHLDRRGSAPMFGMTRLTYTLTLPTLEGVAIEGSGDVEADFGGADSVTISIEGSGDIDGTGIDAQDITVSIDGSGDITVSGSTEDLEASISGSGEIDAEDLDSTDAVASIEGSGDIRVHATGTLEASIEGSGSIRHSGSADVTKNIDGSGSVTQD